MHFTISLNVDGGLIIVLPIVLNYELKITEYNSRIALQMRTRMSSCTRNDLPNQQFDDKKLENIMKEMDI